MKRINFKKIEILALISSVLFSLNSCAPKLVVKHDINDFEFIFCTNNASRHEADVQFDDFYPKAIEQINGQILDVFYCGLSAPFVIETWFYLYGVILEVSFSPEAFEAEFKRLKETPSSSKDDSPKYLFDDSKKLFYYDVFVNEYPCFIFGRGAYRYALVDYNSYCFQYVYLKYSNEIQYSEYFCFDGNLLPKNLEQNEHYESYDGYYYSYDFYYNDKKRIDDYWPTDIE